MHGYKSPWRNPTPGITGDFGFTFHSGKVRKKDLDLGMRLCPGQFCRYGCNGLQSQVSMCWYSSSTYKSCCLGGSAALRPWEGKCLCLSAEWHRGGAREVRPGHLHPCWTVCCEEGPFLGTNGGPGMNCLSPVRKTIALMVIFLMGVSTASKRGVMLPAYFIRIM